MGVPGWVYGVGTGWVYRVGIPGGVPSHLLEEPSPPTSDRRERAQAAGLGGSEAGLGGRTGDGGGDGP